MRLALSHCLPVVVIALSLPAAAQSELSVRVGCPGPPDGSEFEAHLVSGPRTRLQHLKVIFIQRAPSMKEVDQVQRGCLAEAVQRDGSRDIFVTPWLRARKGGDPYEDKMLYPYSGPKVLSYQASGKSTAVRERDTFIPPEKK